MEKKQRLIWFVKRCLLALTVAALCYLMFGVIGGWCLFRRITGLPCLTCGMGRAWLCALRLDFVRAFFWHPLFWTLPLLVLLFLFCNRLPKKAVVAAAAILAVLFAGTYIVRMVWLFPRTPPMTVNENAPLNRLLRLFRWLT